MCEGDKGQCRLRKKQQKAACACCTIVLIVILIIILILYFSVFKPSDPNVQVPMMHLDSINLAANESSLDFTIDLQISVYNPNHATFYIEAGSTACVYYHGYQAGYTSIPPSYIPSQSSATFSVTINGQASSSVQGLDYLNSEIASSIPLSTAVTINGEVTTLGTFSHHSDVVSKCDVKIAFNIRSIDSYSCQSSYSLG